MKVTTRILGLGLLLLLLFFSMSVTASPVEIVWWAPSWTTDAAESIVTSFNQSQSNIRVRVEFFPWDGMREKYETVLRAGAGPDVLNVAVDWTRPFASSGYLVDITSLAKRDFDLSDFFPGAMETAQIAETLYGLPYRTESVAMFYNKEFLQRAGFSAENPPLTWEDYERFAKESAVPGRLFPVGLPGSGASILVSRLASFLYGAGASILSDDLLEAVINSPEAAEAVDYYVSLSRTCGPPGAASLTNDDLARLFQAGILGSLMEQPGFIQTLEMSESDVEFVVVPIPAGKAGSVGILRGWNVVIPAASKHEESAWEFVKYFLRPENMAIFTVTLPGRKSAFDHPRFADPLYEAFVEQLETAKINPGIPAWPAIEDVIWTETQGVYVGRQTAEQAVKRMDAEINRLLRRQ
jgi:ABC-type glycerol-3-phosphate transport system substrate-binding protein